MINVASFYALKSSHSNSARLAKGQVVAQPRIKRPNAVEHQPRIITPNQHIAIVQSDRFHRVLST